MSQSLKKIGIYLEIGKKRTFASARDWPGWCRSGRDESSALQSLFEYGSRYARVLNRTRLGFKAPAQPSALTVIERLDGNATTDFGVPDIPPLSDSEPVSSAELKRFERILKACWRTFDENVSAASGRALRTGPRGGGRELEGIIQHVLGSDGGYLAALGWKFQQDDADDLEKQLDRTRQAILKALPSSARGEIPARGPRGGIRWSPRYFVRRLAWHVLDHAWEIEDRVLSGEED